jgi:hypothetical protein
LDRNFDRAIESHDLDLSKRESEALQQVDWSSAFEAGNLAANKWVHIYS